MVEDIGLYDYGARWYDPVIGRFPTVDPISSKLPWVSVYNYAENSPISYVDFWGLQAVFFQSSGRVGASSSVMVGPTISFAYGIAVDDDLNVLGYRTESYGIGLGAFAGAGNDIGFTLGSGGVNDLLGPTLSIGYIQALEIIGPAMGGEINFAISTDRTTSSFLEMLKTKPKGLAAAGVSFSPPALGVGIGFLGYFDVSNTTELFQFNLEELGVDIQEWINRVFQNMASGDENSSKKDADELKKLMEHLTNQYIEQATQGKQGNDDNAPDK